MFKSIQTLCDANDIRFTLFVDDMTFSGESVTPHFASRITKIVESAGMKISEGKTRYYSKSKPKLITGVIVNGKNLKVRNKHHNAIYTDFAELKACENEGDLSAAYNRVLGRLNAAGQISDLYKSRAKTLLNSKEFTVN